MSNVALMAHRLVSAVALAVALGLCIAAKPGPGHATAGRTCPVTIPPPDWKPSGPDFGPGQFNYGNERLRAALYWPRGILTAGTLPDGGVMAVIARDGSISLKLGWWRGVPGRLVITGRRLDRPGGRIRADVPPNESYGDVGFIPSRITFPSLGCWRVVGKQGGASLTFVVKVTKVKRSGER
jgi:hypothetical protein